MFLPRTVRRRPSSPACAADRPPVRPIARRGAWQEKQEERQATLMQSIDAATAEARRSAANIEHLQANGPRPGCGFASPLSACRQARGEGAGGERREGRRASQGRTRS